MSRLRVYLIPAALALALIVVSAAGADRIGSTVASVNLAPGGSTTVTYELTETGDDGCNAPVGATLDPDPGITVSPKKLSFAVCGDTVTVTVSASSETPDGEYTVALSVDDGHEASPSTLTVNVATPPSPPDTTPPTITVVPPAATEATSASGAVVTFAASATDDVDGSLPVSCVPASGSTFPIGTTGVSCTAEDNAGNTATAGFNVEVRDTTAPVVAVPASPLVAEATSATGAVVTFAASATDAVAGSPPASCTPESGSAFPVGSTTVTCTASDAAGNQGSASFTVQVTDATPTVVVPSTQTVEASGPGGSRVTYVPAPSASDVVDGPLPVDCTPPSGALFPVGSTRVTCTAVDSSNGSASGSFLVQVVDTTPPVVTAPPAATFVGDGGPMPRSTPALAAYLARGRATDIVTLEPILYVEAPDVFPLGETIVRYIAVDGAGNAAEATTRITIVPPPPPGQPRPPPPPPVDPPPGNVTTLRVVRGDRFLRLSWTAPPDADVVRYAAFRTERGGPQAQVYNGSATSFTDRGLVNGQEYRYVVVAYDRAGNRSVGVAITATPQVPMLLTPRDGARVSRRTVFTWRRVPGARYYNFQLFFQRAGSAQLQKVLSAWPVTNRFRLRATWRFDGRVRRLVPGTYRWFVWPGFGPRSDSRYGDLLGERGFVVVRR